MFDADLRQSQRPAILVGGGAYRARDAVIAFAVKHQIPCFRTWNALDIITDDLAVYCGTVGTYGGQGRNFGIQNCDLLLALGCKFSGKITGGLPETFARGARKYIVDIDPAMLDPKYQQVKGDFNILSDVADFMPTIEHEAYVPLAHMDWLKRCIEWRDKYDPVTPEMLSGEMHHYGFMRILSELLPSNAIVVSDTGGNVIMMGHCFKSKRGQRIFSSNGNTPMGFAFCGALGAWFADPSRPVICIIGDGGFNMNIQEIQTMVNYGCKVKTFIINNHVLGNTKSFQRVNKMKEIACGPDGYKPPDFLKIAAAYGVVTYHVPEYLELRPITTTIVNAVLACDEGIICDVPHDDFCQYEPRVSRWDCGIEESYPFLPEAEFLENVINPMDGWRERCK